MEKRKPLIFVTNDDGYEAGGIKALIECVSQLGDVVVVAPDGPRSGMSSAITSLQPLRVNLLCERDNVKLYVCNGTPVDCVKLGINEIAERKPDLVVTGINHGSNAAISVLYSGTMGAAMEGCIFKVPSIGFSLLDHNAKADFNEAHKVVVDISRKVLEEGLPIGTCLNVNIPKGKYNGIKICHQTRGQWVDEFLHSKDGLKKDIYWLTGRFQDDEPNTPDSDEWALAHGYVSIVPVKIDMTDYQLLARLKNWE